MRISDWSSDVCSSDLALARHAERSSLFSVALKQQHLESDHGQQRRDHAADQPLGCARTCQRTDDDAGNRADQQRTEQRKIDCTEQQMAGARQNRQGNGVDDRSEEHTSELQSLMRISYAVFCLNKNKYVNQQY